MILCLFLQDTCKYQRRCYRLGMTGFISRLVGSPGSARRSILRLSNLSKRQRCRSLVRSGVVDGVDNGQLGAISRNNLHVMKVSVVADHWLSLCRRVNRPKTDIHREAHLHAWACSLQENLDLKIPTISWLEWLSGPKLCTNNMAYAAYLFYSWKSGISVHARQTMPMWQAPRACENPGYWVSNRLFW